MSQNSKPCASQTVCEVNGGCGIGKMNDEKMKIMYWAARKE